MCVGFFSHNQSVQSANSSLCCAGQFGCYHGERRGVSISIISQLCSAITRSFFVRWSWRREDVGGRIVTLRDGWGWHLSICH